MSVINNIRYIRKQLNSSIIIIPNNAHRTCIYACLRTI